MSLIGKHIHQPNGSRLLFVFWVIITFSCALYSSNTILKGYSFDSSILNLLPMDDRSKSKLLAEENFSNLVNQKILLLLETEASNDNLDTVKKIDSTLKKSKLFVDVSGKVNEKIQKNNLSFYQNSRYQLLTEESITQLQQQDKQLVDVALGRLYSPLAPLLSKTLIEDPLQLYWQWETSVTPKTVLDSDNGWLIRRIENKKFYVFRLTLAEDPFDLTYQKTVIATIEKIKQTLPTQTTLLHSGLLFHAAYGAKQAQNEMSTIGIGSIIGIIFILFFCFRRLRYVILVFVPITVGCLLATTLSILVFDKVHLITLAFGATLIGVAIDYPLHYICANFIHDNRPSNSTLGKIFVSLSLGLLSSVLAYSAQGIAPFPGLRQMAFFSAVGLIGGWLTVICWMPILLKDKSPYHYPKLMKSLQRLREYLPTIATPTVRYVFIVITVISVSIVFLAENESDVRALQTSSLPMLKQDVRIKYLLGDDNIGSYFALEADSEQSLLELEEQFSKSLRTAIAEGVITHFMATSLYIPSIKKQVDNYRLLKNTVYRDGKLLDDFIEKSQLHLIEAASKKSFDSVQFTELLIENSPQYFSSHLWLGQHQNRYYSIVTLHGGSHATHEANQYFLGLIKNTPEITYVNRSADLSFLLSEYKAQVVQWLLVAYLVLSGLLAIRYRKATWRIIAVPALASLLTLSILVLGGATITLFHYFALLLIVGIGLDSNIFLYDSKHSPHTWLAVILSSFTTLLAFGLLSLSQTPVLHYFGETILLGIFFVLVLSPFFRVTKVDHNAC